MEFVGEVGVKRVFGYPRKRTWSCGGPREPEACSVAGACSPASLTTWRTFCFGQLRTRSTRHRRVSKRCQQG
eukprot:497494-Rhodomonas_salina.1